MSQRVRAEPLSDCVTADLLKVCLQLLRSLQQLRVLAVQHRMYAAVPDQLACMPRCWHGSC